MAFRTDQVLWYNNGDWGRLGYGVPNVGNDPVTVNNGIRYLVEVTGRNLAGIMHVDDVDLRKPPSINTLTKVHKLITRARTILAGRQVPANKPMMEAIHATPAPQDHLIFPVPFFRVRNAWLKEWAGYILGAISEAVQHTDNRRAYDFSMEFSGIVGQYLHRVYWLMSTELFGVPAEQAKDPSFTLSDEQLGAYDPSRFFTSTELIDTAPPLTDLPTEDDLVILTDGIPATQLVGVCQWPSARLAVGNESIAAAAEAASASSGSSFAPPPSP